MTSAAKKETKDILKKIVKDSKKDIKVKSIKQR